MSRVHYNVADSGSRRSLKSPLKSVHPCTASCLSRLYSLSVRALTGVKLRPSLVSVVYLVSEDIDWCETQTQSCLLCTLSLRIFEDIDWCETQTQSCLLCTLSVRTLSGMKLRPSLVTQTQSCLLCTMSVRTLTQVKLTQTQSCLCCVPCQ